MTRVVLGDSSSRPTEAIDLGERGWTEFVPDSRTRMPMTVILIDNYDSFTFNLFHYLGGLGAEVVVHRNDKIATAEVIAADPDAIVLSPGPCTPDDAGICLDLIEKASHTIPVFGVCLGHQAIGQVFGGRVVRA